MSLTSVPGLEHLFYYRSMPRSPLTPDTALEIALNGLAGRLAGDRTLARDAVAQLQRLATGRDDLLAKAAGGKLGGFMGQPGMTNPNDVLAAAYLLLAGADPEVARDEADRVRARVGSSPYSL
jgi:hypothetical protein